MTAVPIDTGTPLKWGAPQPLFQTIFRGGAYASYAVSRDGQRFLTIVPPSLEETLPVTVLMNWTSALRK
ncbi:MAG TPA: hypothetical protein VM818_08980 [Vicinamibacterales bacterium]|jgi:hypothetical protein|nr:hypothetical protein [Vicinamibacterales bacterium]